jgi:hypothetical protein
MKQSFKFSVFGFLLLLALTARAQFTVQVTPGFVFPTGWTNGVTYAELNLLGTPTVSVTGTTSGTNFITPGSITPNLFNTTIADGIFITLNGTGGAIDAAPGAWAGPGLIGGVGLNWDGLAALQVYADTNYFALKTNSIANTNSYTVPVTQETANPALWLTLTPWSLTDTNVSPTAMIQGDKLAILPNHILSGGLWNGGILYPTNAPGMNTMLGLGLMIAQVTTNFYTTNGAQVTYYTETGPALVLQQFTSGLYPLAAGVVANVAHGLGGTPRVVRWVLVNQSGEYGYQPGDEVPVEQILWAGNFNYPMFASRANTTNVSLAMTTGTIDSLSITNGGQVNFTPSAWQAKCYARP